MIRSRIVFCIWALSLLLLFFYKGQPAVTVLIIFTAAYAVAAFLLTRLSGREISIGFTGGDMVSKGETVKINMELRNRGKLPVFCCICEAAAKNLLTGTEEKHEVTLSLPPGSSRSYRFDLTESCCGKVELHLAKLTVSDPLQLFKAERQAGGDGPAVSYFAPQLHPADIPAEFLDSYNMESYQYSQYEKGSDPGEVFGIREYQEGDSLKQVHWKLTAKLDELTVKIPSFPIENNILLILDNLIDPETGVPAMQRSALVELLYSLSAHLLEKSIPHSIGWYDTKEQVFRSQAIRNEEELWASVPEVLSCGFEASETSTIYRYLESTRSVDFTNHFLVSVQERDTERLEQYGAVNVFRTTE